jgi:hypothetical protein
LIKLKGHLKLIFPSLEHSYCVPNDFIKQGGLLILIYSLYAIV